MCLCDRCRWGGVSPLSYTDTLSLREIRSGTKLVTHLAMCLSLSAGVFQGSFVGQGAHPSRIQAVIDALIAKVTQ